MKKYTLTILAIIFTITGSVALGEDGTIRNLDQWTATTSPYIGLTPKQAGRDLVMPYSDAIFGSASTTLLRTNKILLPLSNGGTTLDGGIQFDRSALPLDNMIIEDANTDTIRIRNASWFGLYDAGTAQNTIYADIPLGNFTVNGTVFTNSIGDLGANEFISIGNGFEFAGTTGGASFRLGDSSFVVKEAQENTLFTVSYPVVPGGQSHTTASYDLRSSELRVGTTTPKATAVVQANWMPLSHYGWQIDNGSADILVNNYADFLNELEVGDFVKFIDENSTVREAIVTARSSGTITTDYLNETGNTIVGNIGATLFVNRPYPFAVYSTSTQMLKVGDGANSGYMALGNVTPVSSAILKIGGNSSTIHPILLDNPVYDDLQFPISSAKVPASGAPNWETFTTNTEEYAFGINEHINTQANELPHWWKQGTLGDAHLHFTLKTANNTGADRFARFQVTFAYADTNETWVEQVVTATSTIPTGSAALKSFYLDLGDLTFTNYLIGGQVKANVKRVAVQSGTEYADDVFITQVGVHLQKDTLGSRQELTK